MSIIINLRLSKDEEWLILRKAQMLFRKSTGVEALRSLAMDTLS